MITEKQVNEFEQKAKEDALKAFNDMLSTFKLQSDHIHDLNEKLKKQKDLLSKWAKEAHYRVDWYKYTAKPFKNVGTCQRCAEENIGRLDYNDGHLVCEPCFDRLCDQFDDEYK